MKIDRDISPKEIQRLSSAEALAGFFAYLGYQTDCRITQTAANLGITAEGTLRPIKRIELLADQEGLLQVYLFEVRSVTVAHTRALARAFDSKRTSLQPGAFHFQSRADDDTSEGKNAPVLSAHKVADFYLRRALDLLARDIGPRITGEA
jgi:hypothetical protein